MHGNYHLHLFCMHHKSNIIGFLFVCSVLLHVVAPYWLGMLMCMFSTVYVVSCGREFFCKWIEKKICFEISLLTCGHSLAQQPLFNWVPWLLVSASTHLASIYVWLNLCPFGCQWRLLCFTGYPVRRLSTKLAEGQSSPRTWRNTATTLIYIM